MDDRISADATLKMSPVVESGRGDLFRAMMTGAIVGLITGVLFYILSKFVFGSILCQDGAGERCGEVVSYAMPTSIIIASVVALITLVQLRVYRPLLVVIAATVALWNYQLIGMSVAWYWGLLISVVLFALMYMLFTWLARIRSFIITLVVVIVALVIIRLLIVS